MIESISAAPTKAFFVKMLTRDIDLRDAILDLLDNCVDGIIRSTHPKKGDSTPYRSYYAKITATPEQFIIEDNCGGISIEIARNVAFRLGRPADRTPEELETVGVYGIGMKRAIFKLGSTAKVESEHNGTRFSVDISTEWMNNDQQWDLDLSTLNPTGHTGTRIEVIDLHAEIKREFTTSQSTFLSELSGAISQLYAVIMEKGFTVELNGQKLEPIGFKLLISKTGVGINPYVFRGRFGQVQVEVVVGFYRSPLTEDEINEENESPKANLAQAGWSVICNDRLVLRGDKTAMTGWGTADVPRFHNQFSSIAGVVTMHSTKPELLPLNTTKRGIETSSDVYFRVLDFMRKGVKQFTDYTNKWKLRYDETKEQFRKATPTPAAEIPDALPNDEYKKVSSKQMNTDSEGTIFNPELPKPPKEETDTRRISFTRPLEEIKLLAEGLLGDVEATPTQVGEACFDNQLDKYKRTKRKS